MASSSAGAPSSSRAILNSPFLNLSMVDKALSTTSDPIERINLLSAKIHVLTRSQPADATSNPLLTSSNPSSSRGGDAPRTRRLEEEIQILRVRLELARSFMDVAGRMIEAEAELTTALGECRRLLKRASRRRQRDKEQDDDNVSGQAETMERGDVRNHDGRSDDDSAEDLDEIQTLRIEGLRMLVLVEEAMGREGRAKRWRGVIEELTRSTEGSAESLDKG